MSRITRLAIGLCGLVWGLGMLALPLRMAGAEEAKTWIELIPPGKELEAWERADGWIVAGDAQLDPTVKSGRKLLAVPGRGVLISSLEGLAMERNLRSKQHFADLEVHVEFLISKGSNAGVKLQGLYEIQILDSFGQKKLHGDSCGGVYPRAELTPRYHTIDEGVPPRLNAAKPAGQWQTLDMEFRAPRFDGQGRKVENARFLKVVLNGQVIHENVELRWPTGYAWKVEKEVPVGPLFLQGDHGPVAYRNVRVRPLERAAQ